MTAVTSHAPRGLERDAHPAQRGFVSTGERDWVLDSARGPKDGPSPDDARFRERAWRWLADIRSGGVLPIPLLSGFRRWDLSRVVPRAVDEPDDYYNDAPEQNGFADDEERDGVLLNARATAGTFGVTYSDVWFFLLARRAGTPLLMPSYKHLRNSWVVP